MNFSFCQDYAGASVILSYNPSVSPIDIICFGPISGQKQELETVSVSKNSVQKCHLAGAKISFESSQSRQVTF